MNITSDEILKFSCDCAECVIAIKNPGVMHYVKSALTTIREHDVPLPDCHTTLRALHAALDARAILVAASFHSYSTQDLQLMLDWLLLLCISADVDVATV